MPLNIKLLIPIVVAVAVVVAVLVIFVLPQGGGGTTVSSSTTSPQTTSNQTSSGTQTTTTADVWKLEGINIKIEEPPADLRSQGIVKVVKVHVKIRVLRTKPVELQKILLSDRTHQYNLTISFDTPPVIQGLFDKTFQYLVKSDEANIVNKYNSDKTVDVYIYVSVDGAVTMKYTRVLLTTETPTLPTGISFR